MALLPAAVSLTIAPVLQVEDYMTDIITKMRSELREILQGSVTDYPSKLREKWLFDWPSQIILVVNQIYWCQEVEEAFAAQGKGNKNALAVSTTVKAARADQQPVQAQPSCSCHTLAWLPCGAAQPHGCLSSFK